MPKEREVLGVDALFVGAGPASLAGAIRLMQLQEEHNRTAAEKKELLVAVIEKSSGLGRHNLSGAILDPRALDELMPDWREQDPPVESWVTSHEVRYLFRRRSLRAPITPPPLANKGFPIVSLSRFTRWLGGKAEAMGANIFDHFPARELIREEGRVAGVRCGDRGVDKAGREKENFEPGAEIRSPVTVLAEGTRGSLTRALVERDALLAHRNPQGYALGIKEVWKVRPEKFRPGHVSHTMGFPLGRKTFGGGFIYHMGDNHVSVGLVISLDYRDALMDPYEMMQRFKGHPFLRRLLEGGGRVAYGAKTIPEGGYYAVPRLAVDGCLIAGDAAGLVNAQRIKGLHLAMKSGIEAAETVWEALAAGDVSARFLSVYERRIMDSWAGKELRRVRNFHQAFHRGLVRGMPQAALQYVTRGRGLVDPIRVEEDARTMEPLPRRPGARPEKAAMKYDGTLSFSREDNVFFSGTEHEEDQPCHLEVPDTAVCLGRCAEEYGNPCQYFCPAKVYEFVEGEEGRSLQVNFSNCLHCKTCDIKDPFGNIIWRCPEGGGGPKYTIM
ncbi:MAG: electron transfer flavoprotein-ubiquinone oxidoreductase [bacterium]|nr:electron transfer flavoprotein-ubiquinone oxidoreductase [bacterium]